MAAKMVPVGELCRFLAGEGQQPLTATTIGRYVVEGMPKASRGRYDLYACASWQLARLRTLLRATEAPGSTAANLEDERRRLVAAQADLSEIEAERQRGALVPAGFFEAAVGRMQVAAERHLMTLPARLAPKLEACTRGEVKSLLSAALRNALTELAKGNIART